MSLSMKKILFGLVIFAAASVIGGVILTAVYTGSVSDEVTRLRRENRSDMIYLRTRVRELESQLATEILKGQTPPTVAVGGEASEETRVPDTEEVTVPAHKAPETQPSGEDTQAGISDEETAAARYILTEHDGVIGVFDASGELLRTVNVFVMTLPEAEREALAVGIPAYSYEEMCELLEQYE